MKVSKVKLRKFKNKKGNYNYWKLDIYPPIRNQISGKNIRFINTGVWTWTKPIGEDQKHYNRVTLGNLKALQSKYQLDIQNRTFDFLDSHNMDRDFLEYFLEIANTKRNSVSNYKTWLIVYSYLREFSSNICFKDLSIEFADNFRNYLLSRPHKRKKGQIISPNSANSYFSKFIYTLKEAYKYDILKENLAVKIDRIKGVEVKKEFLTHEEVMKLMNTQCKDIILKRACLFMIHSGQRVSDIENLIWEDIQHSAKTGYFIQFKHQKTSKQQMLTLSDEAIDLLGAKQKESELIFPSFKRNYISLSDWVKDAGINKEVGFHTFRHTSATLLLSAGVDVVQVKERLGHSDIKTTMGYIKLLSENKIKAANAITFKK